MRKISGSSV